MGKCKNCGKSKDLYENGLCEICEAERRCKLVDEAIEKYGGPAVL